jgi:hypothetical protein
VRRAAFIVVLTIAALAAPAAVGKENVQATLLTRLPANAAPGDVVTIRWQLVAVENGKKRPFRAGGVFVRLRSGAGETPALGLAEGDGANSGIYEARVAVPAGGIAGVEIGLRGFTSGPEGTATSDLVFPITNPPPQAALAQPPPGGPSVGDDEGASGSPWAILAAAIAAALAGYLLIRVRRRRTRLGVLPPTTSRGPAA